MWLPFLRTLAALGLIAGLGGPSAFAASGVQAPTAGAVRGPYAHLRDGTKIGKGEEYTWWQRKRIFDENRRRNGGVLRSDDPNNSFQVLRPAQISRAGEPGLPDDAVVDHIRPKVSPKGKKYDGTNSYWNARVVSRAHNLHKSNLLDPFDSPIAAVAKRSQAKVSFEGKRFEGTSSRLSARVPSAAGTAQKFLLDPFSSPTASAR